MKILGLHINTGQTTAALAIDGRIRHGAAEERFNRIKQSRAFPREAIEYCLAQAGLKGVEQLDALAVSWNPAENMRRINLSGFTSWRRYDPEWLYIVPNQIMSMTGKEAFAGDFLKMEFGGGCPIYFVEHHRAHLADAICQSPFGKGLAVAVDEYGEYHSATLARFRGNKLQIVGRTPYPNSLGVFYAACTEYLGFYPNSDEWKVMGASAYGDAKRYAGKLEQVLGFDARKGELILDTRYCEHSNMKRAGYLNERLAKLIGFPPRKKGEALGQRHYDLAAAAQAVFEKRLFKLLTYYARKTGETALAASGGCFMNSLANGKILKKTPFTRLFIPFAPADNGGAVGSALYVWHYALGHSRKALKEPPSPFLGPEYSDRQIREALGKWGLTYKRKKDPIGFSAEQLAAGKLLGWFQGKMEYGERALGNRSILADPRHESMKEAINAAVKYREGFRPFAPAVLSEKARDYFDLPARARVPYMEQVYPVKRARRREIPAVVHEDGSGRLQMVSKQMNPRFYDLIRAFGKITGVPVLLNTSFNVQGQPIVCSPQDAIRTFFTCGLDCLVLGNYVVEK